jgi:ubiquinone/menaquinone biosynthesis C-methylase UbiE
VDTTKIRNAPASALGIADRTRYRLRGRVQSAVGRLRETPRRARNAYHNSDFYLSGHAPQIKLNGAEDATAVDEYWNEWTVNSTPFETARESADYLEWRFEEYPLFREMAGLWGDHTDEVVLDYGCGPGNDVVGLLTNTKAQKVIGMDISRKALELTRRRIALHKVDTDRVELIQISDAEPVVPLEADSVDYFQSMGVIHITTDPGAVLKELHRVLRPGREARVMVYNQDSIWFHLFTPYVKQILEGKWTDLPVEEAFQKNTDGEDCPIARSYTHQQFGELCEAAGFEVDYVGGHLSKTELEAYAEHAEAALADDRLDERHKQFLRELEFDSDGYPLWSGKHAGVGGVYELRS